MLSEKLNYLKLVKQNYADLIVHYINQPSHEVWPSSKTLNECSDKELEQINLIRLLPYEIILDIEEKYKLKFVLEKVKEKNWTYEVWNTGSRGYHVYLKFSNLEEQSLEVRNRIRKYIINEFGTDEAVAKETQFISCPYAPHFKTNNIKTLTETGGPGTPNIIPQKIIEYIESEIKLKKDFVLEDDEDFKEFDEDPYLKYVLSKKIVDGERNGVLFKNLAIGLVKSGKNRMDILNIARRIVNNCPGKNVAEFMGWVDKALSGEMTDFNKGEIIQWAIKWNHPILYNLHSEKKFTEVLTIKMLWDVLWDAKIAAQPVWRELCFYNLIGTIVDERDDDYRVHVIFSSPPGSGKDEGLNLMQKVLDDLGLDTVRPSSATDKTLVGGLNQEAINYNTKWGLDSSADDTEKKQFRREIEEGWLKHVHWMAFGESETIFKPGAFNRQVHIILRQAMDKARRIEKGVGARRITVNTNTSFILTTYSMDDIIYKLLHNGLFQRALYYDKTLSKEEHNSIQQKICEYNYNPTIREHYDEGAYYDLLLKTLKSMRTWYTENRKNIQYFKDCNLYIEHLWTELEKSYEFLPPTDRNILDSIVRRSNNNLNKLLILHAVWNKKLIIEKRDVDECFNLIKICVESIKKLILKQDSVKKKRLIVLDILKGRSLKSMDLYAKIKTQAGTKSTRTISRMISELKELGCISEFRDGNTIRLSLTPKGAELVDNGE